MGEKSYVKLTKEQEASLQDVTPGELNQPIDIHEVFKFITKNNVHVN